MMGYIIKGSVGQNIYSHQEEENTSMLTASTFLCFHLKYIVCIIHAIKTVLPSEKQWIFTFIIVFHISINTSYTLSLFHNILINATPNFI
jgi:hypothetical protein